MARDTARSGIEINIVGVNLSRGERPIARCRPHCDCSCVKIVTQSDGSAPSRHYWPRRALRKHPQRNRERLTYRHPDGQSLGDYAPQYRASQNLRKGTETATEGGPTHNQLSDATVV